MAKDNRNQRLAKYLGEMVSYYHRFSGCEIDDNVCISKDAILDRANPKGIHIGNNCVVGGKSMILPSVQ